MRALAVAVGALLLIPALAAASTGSIAGKVTDASSHTAIESVNVCAYNASSLEYEGCESTDATGDYTISGLAAGSYKVQFSAFGSLNYVSQYYNGKSSFANADAVAVTGATTTSSIDAEMHAGGQIKGTVTDGVTKGALEEVEVCASPGGATEFLHCATTNGSGQYTISALKSGSYKIKFSPPYSDSKHVTQYYNAKSTFATADSVSVTEGAATTGIDAELPEGGRISGSVTKPGGGAPSESINVCAIPTPYESGSYHCAYTNGSGTYTITGLHSGNYNVWFNSGLNYLAQYYNAKESETEATPVSVTLGATTSGINAALSAAGLITGRVTDAVSKSALGGISACAIKVGTSSNPYGHCGYFQTNGEYTIGGLPPGEYKVKFEAGYGEISPGVYGQLNYLTQYYNGKSLEREANAVTVAGGSTTPHIDAEMHEGGRLTGTVTNAVTHTPIEGVSVCAQPVARHTESSHCMWTNSEGKYTISGLPTGEYTVRFEPGYNDSNDLKQFYNGKATHKEAELVQVTAGSTTSNINAQMQEGGKITGKVIDAATKTPIEGIEVCASPHGYCGTTDASGEYELYGLATGEYTVGFSTAYNAANFNYVAQFYNGKGSGKEADEVTATAGTTTTNINAEMHEGGKISGKVIDAVTKAGVRVSACASSAGSSNSYRCAYTNEHGEYTIEGLAAGSYKVQFYPETEYEGPEAEPVNRNYLFQYYNGKPTSEAADLVSVTAGVTTSNISAEMHEGAKITGKVIDAASKASITTAEACASESGGEGELFDCARTNEHGEYTLEGLPTGSYIVSFSVFVPGFESSQNNYLWQSYNGKGPGETANPVSATAGSTTSNINAELHPGGQIKGRVTAASSGAGIEGVQACAFEPSEEGYSAGCATTNANGEYTIMGLPTGSYKIEFSDRYYEYEEEYNFEEEVTPEELFTTQFYSGKSSSAQGESVAVTAGATVTGINASLVEPSAATAKPENIELPTLSGVPIIGEPLSCSHGTWTESPTSYAVRWLRDGVEINGQTSSVYEVRAADQGHELSCKVTASNSKGSTSAVSNTVEVPAEGSAPQEHTLAVTVAGTGSGTVTSVPSGISCSPSCAHAFTDGTSLVLTAVPTEGSTFAGWSGNCTGTAPCHITISANSSVTATFTAKSGGGSEGGGGSPSGGGSGGGGGSANQPPPSPAPTPKAAVLKCKKGFKKEKAHGKERCVKARKKHHH